MKEQALVGQELYNTNEVKSQVRLMFLTVGESRLSIGASAVEDVLQDPAPYKSQEQPRYQWLTLAVQPTYTLFFGVSCCYISYTLNWYRL